MNPMKSIRIEKITLNIGAGKDTGKLDKGMKLIKNITSIDPVKTITQKRIAAWALRPGLPIGCKLTLRGEDAKKLLARLIQARDNKLEPKQFTDNGSISFGIPEYIDIPGVEYYPDIGIMGFEVSVTLDRPGYRVQKRRLKKGKVSRHHKVSKEEAIQFMKDEFKVIVGDE